MHLCPKGSHIMAPLADKTSRETPYFLNREAWERRLFVQKVWGESHTSFTLPLDLHSHGTDAKWNRKGLSNWTKSSLPTKSKTRITVWIYNSIVCLLRQEHQQSLKYYNSTQARLQFRSGLVYLWFVNVPKAYLCKYSSWGPPPSGSSWTLAIMIPGPWNCWELDFSQTFYLPFSCRIKYVENVLKEENLRCI